MGQVDHEARVASGGAEADPPGVDEHDRGVRLQFRQPARRGQAGEAGAEHHPVGLHGAAQRRTGGRRRQGFVPAAATVVLRQEIALQLHGAPPVTAN
ncbi:hypothetical protein D3C78_1701220 [compost metagenome]